MAVLRVAHVWGDRLLEVRHLAGNGSFGPLTVEDGTIRFGNQQLTLAPGEQRELDDGPTRLQLQVIEAEPALPFQPLEDTDWEFTKLAICLLMIAGALVTMFVLQVQFGPGVEDGLIPAPPIVLRIVKETPPKHLEAVEAAATKAEEKPEPKPETTSRGKPLEVKKVGLLGEFDQLKGLGAIFEPGGLSTGLNNALDGLRGHGEIGDARGLSFGPRGGLPGGDGLGIGPGGPGLTRRPPGIPSGLGKKVDAGPCCSELKVTDGLTKDVIARVIRLHFSEIKYCYERAMQQRQDLSGKVMVMFTIDPTGAVSDANVAESTLEDETAESCMLARIRRWKFPEPRGGGVVSVSHPWFFKPAGSADSE